MNISDMDIVDIEYKILDMCQQGNLEKKDVDFLNNVFQNNILDVNFDGCEFILTATFYKNHDMIKLLIKNNAKIDVEDYKPLRLALQNEDEEGVKLLKYNNLYYMYNVINIWSYYILCLFIWFACYILFV